MLLNPEELDDKEQKMIDNLCHLAPEVKVAQELVNAFMTMILERRAERFEGWISQVVENRIQELKAFADSLKQDQPEVAAALSYERSNGRIEAQVNRLKLIKCAMYGRRSLIYLKHEGKQRPRPSQENL
jgi:transposase